MSYWYMLGLIIAGGTITSEELTIRFPFKSWGKNLNVRQNWLRQSLSEIRDELNDWLNVECYPDFAVTKKGSDYLLVVRNPPTILIDLLRNLAIPTSGEIRNNPNFSLQESISAMRNDKENIANFCRGIADVLGSVQASQSRGTVQRVSVEFRQANWRLPLEFCGLLHRLGIAPDYIHWGHPNMQTSQSISSHAWKKGHKVRVKAFDFARLGFHLDCKQRPFMRRIGRKTGNAAPICPKRNLHRTSRSKHVDERDATLPLAARRHFENWNMICRALGCPFAAKRISR